MNVSNYSDHQSPQFRVLSAPQCRELYLATLECLNRVGVLVHSEHARHLLAEAGARVKEKRVYIPAHLIQDAVASAPRNFSLWRRDGQGALQVAPGHVHFGPGPSCTYYVDPFTLQRRRARRGDAGLTARVCDALPNLDYAMSLSLFDDVTPVLSPVYEFAELLANTAKPVVAWANDTANLADIYAMAVAVAGGEEALQQRPFLAYFANYESPLRHAQAPVDNLIWAAEHGLPVVYLGGPTVGLESPVTGASGLVLYLAAALSGLAIVQLARRGAPVVIGGVPSAMDLRTARPAYGSPEMSLHVAAAAELAHYLELPFMGTAGASESKRLDAQAASEASIQILMSALSGASLVHDLGFLDCADIGSPAFLVFLDEVIAMVRRILRGVPVNQATIQLDLIEQVGPGGLFIAEPDSAAHCRTEIWVPGLFDRDAHTIWEQKGSRGVEERVVDKLQHILTHHQPPPLPEGAAGVIESSLHAAEARVQAENLQ